MLSGIRAARRALPGTFAWRCLDGLVRVQALDRSMALAAQAFTALIPLLIFVGTLAPAGREDLVPDALVRRFRLGADAADAVRAVFSSSSDASVGALSLVLLLFSGVSFTRRLQRTYVAVWDLPAVKGPRNAANALLGLTALLAGVMLLSVTRSLPRLLPGGWLLGAPLTAAAALLLWTSVPWLLLDRRVAWRRLLPSGALAACCSAVYGLASAVYMPQLFASYSRRYGLFGVTLALVGWLLCIAVIVVCTAVVARELDRAPEGWAGRLRALLRVPSPPAGAGEPDATRPGGAVSARPSGSPAARRGPEIGQGPDQEVVDTGEVGTGVHGSGHGPDLHP